MAEMSLAQKCGKIAVVLARRIREDDSELVVEMGSYLYNFSRMRIERLYKNLVVDRQVGA